MKTCPFCAEQIQDAAIKCRHCLEFLDESRRPQVLMPPALPATQSPGDQLPFYLRTSSIVITFLMVPPFALPLIWLHPKLHLAWKISLTLVIFGFCWLSYKAFVGFIHQFDEATKMLNEMGV